VQRLPGLLQDEQPVLSGRSLVCGKLSLLSTLGIPSGMTKWRACVITDREPMKLTGHHGDVRLADERSGKKVEKKTNKAGGGFSRGIRACAVQRDWGGAALKRRQQKRGSRRGQQREKDQSTPSASRSETTHHRT